MGHITAIEDGSPWSIAKETPLCHGHSWCSPILNKPLACSGSTPLGLGIQLLCWWMGCTTFVGWFGLLCECCHWNDNVHKWDLNWPVPIKGLGVETAHCEIWPVSTYCRSTYKVARDKVGGKTWFSLKTSNILNPFCIKHLNFMICDSLLNVFSSNEKVLFKIFLSVKK